MAYAYTPSEEDKKEEDTGMVIGKPSSTMTTGAVQPSSPQASQAPATSQGAGITDVNKYLSANKEKVQNLGQKVAGVVQGDITGAQEKIRGAESQFRGDVAKNTIAKDQNFVNQAKANPTSFLGTAENQARFKKLYGAEYGGPKDIQDQGYFQDANLATTKAQRTQDLAKKGALDELLMRATDSGSGRYSSGALKLDSALLKSSPQSYRPQQEVDLGSQLEALRTLSPTLVNEARTTTQGTRDLMRNEFDVGKEAQALQEKNQAQIARTIADYEAKAKALQAMNSEGILASKYFDMNRLNQLNPYNLTSKSDYDRLGLLSQLTGATNPFEGYEGQAGQGVALLDPNSAFNKKAYEGDVAKAKSTRLSAEAKAEAAKKAAQLKAQEEALAKLRRSLQMGVGGFSISL